MRDRDVLVLSGPPGAGKTTVAHALVERLDRAVLVNGDSFLDAVVRGGIYPWLPESHSQNCTVIAATAAATREYADGGYAVVVEGTIGPWMLNVFTATLGRPFEYVVLRPTAETAMQRAVARANNGHSDALVDPAPIAAMYEQFSALGEHEKCVLDNTKLRLDQTVDAVLSRMV